ncbi:MAG: glycoside hydrolase family 127 protein [Clostridia bacterium]|nr:glycoside hydrolase family 127 protein [Clostridia bacterium]
MKALSTKQIKPKGWMYRQLKLQAEGLAGNLDKMWPDVRDSKWIGGDREGWERVPYWLDGFIPLAYLLEDEDMIARAKRYVDEILARQCEDGWICPCTVEERDAYDMWALFLICKVLVLYADCSGDERVEDAVYRALRQYYFYLPHHTLHNWGSARWFECLISISWLYERRQEDWLIELADMLHADGVCYRNLLKLWQKREKEWSFFTHVVNIAMALKGECLYRAFMGEKGGDNGEEATALLSVLEKHHGTATGHFTGNECLDGFDPIQGTELCGIVEAMYSYEVLLGITGNRVWADRLETLAFNARPSVISEDMWTRQYDQLVNQIALIPMNEPVIFNSNSKEAHVFGSETNFGCCTANMGQGWPKLCMHAFMTEGNDTLVSAVLVPSEVNTALGGQQISVALDTDYPFKNTLTYTVKRATEFALKIRIPSWAKAFTVNGKPQTADDGWFILHKQFAEGENVNVSFTVEAQFVQRPTGMFTVKRGALLYALPILAEEARIEKEADGYLHTYPYCDYHFTPLEDWQYAFIGERIEASEGEVGSIPFSRNHPAASLSVDMVKIDWGTYANQPGVCAPLPKSTEPIGKPCKKKLVPFGCTVLRMAEMPKL